MIEYPDKAYSVKIDEQKGQLASFVFGGKEYIHTALPLFVLGLCDKNFEL